MIRRLRDGDAVLCRLSYALEVVGEAWFEHAWARSRSECLAARLFPGLVRVAGFEPALPSASGWGLCQIGLHADWHRGRELNPRFPG